MTTLSVLQPLSAAMALSLLPPPPPPLNPNKAVIFLCRRPIPRPRPLCFFVPRSRSAPNFNFYVNTARVGDFTGEEGDRSNNSDGLFTNHHVQEEEEATKIVDAKVDAELDSLSTRLKLHNRVKSLLSAAPAEEEEEDDDDDDDKEEENDVYVDVDVDGAARLISEGEAEDVLPLVETCNLVMDAMFRAKRYNDVKSLFHSYFHSNSRRLLHPNIQSYDILLQSHCLSHSDSDLDQALQIYRYLFDNTHFHLNFNTYTHLFNALIKAARFSDAALTLSDMSVSCLGVYPSWNGHHRDFASFLYQIEIESLVESRNLDKAKELYDVVKPLVSGTYDDYLSLQLCCTFQVSPAFLDSFFRVKGLEKEKEEVAIRVDTINKTVNKCFDHGKLNEAMDVFDSYCKEEGQRMDLSGFNNMIARLSNLHMMSEAEHYYGHLLCNSFSTPDVHTYVPMIDAYIFLNRVDNVLDKFVAMVNLKLQATTSYTNMCFGYLIARGKALDCAPILSKMIRKGMEVDAIACNTVIRGLVNQGHFDTTLYDLLCDMKEFQCNIVGMQTSTDDDSCSAMITAAITPTDDDLDTSVLGLIPPKDGELKRYGLQGGKPWKRGSDDDLSDPELTIAALRPKLQLHHRVITLLLAGNLDAAAEMCFSAPHLLFVHTCNEVMEAMYRAKRYNDVKDMVCYFFGHQLDDVIRADGPHNVPDGDAKSYDIGILSLCELEYGNILDCYKVVRQFNFSLSLGTYLGLRRFSHDHPMAGNLLWDMIRKRGNKHPWVYNLVILDFLNIGLFGEAKKMFHGVTKLRCPEFSFTGVVDTTFLNSFPIEPVEKVVNTNSINTMVNQCFKAGRVKEAMDAFNSFAKGREIELKEHVRMDLAGFNNMIARLCELHMMDAAEHYYQQLWNSYEIPDVHTYIPLMDAYLELGKTDNALDKFMAMVNLELVSDSIPASRLCKWFLQLWGSGRGSKCAQVLCKMLRRGMKVGHNPCSVVLGALVREGRVHDAVNLLSDVKEFEHSIDWYKDGKATW